MKAIIFLIMAYVIAIYYQKTNMSTIEYLLSDEGSGEQSAGFDLSYLWG